LTFIFAIDYNYIDLFAKSKCTQRTTSALLLIHGKKLPEKKKKKKVKSKNLAQYKSRSHSCSLYKE
jgi:hypothetical protein